MSSIACLCYWRSERSHNQVYNQIEIRRWAVEWKVAGSNPTVGLSFFLIFFSSSLPLSFFLHYFHFFSQAHSATSMLKHFSSKHNYSYYYINDCELNVYILCVCGISIQVWYLYARSINRANLKVTYSTWCTCCTEFVSLKFLLARSTSSQGRRVVLLAHGQYLNQDVIPFFEHINSHPDSQEYQHRKQQKAEQL